MTTLRTFVISLLALMILLILEDSVDTEHRQYRKLISTQHKALREEAFSFTVNEQHSVMRFSASGRMPRNTWKSFELAFYDLRGNYLFTVRDDLWSESGVDSDGRWSEHKSYVSFDVQFEHQGEYKGVIYTSSGPRNNSSSHKVGLSINVVPVSGNISAFSPLRFLLFSILGITGLIILVRLDSSNKNASFLGKHAKPSWKGSILFSGALIIALIISHWAAYSTGGKNYRAKVVVKDTSKVYTDRELREHSASGGGGYRSSGARGGK